MKPLSESRLYAFVDTAYLHGRKLTEVAQQLCDGGADLIQLRAKNSSADQIGKMAQAIHSITQRAGVTLAINDHLRIAQETGAELCHLGQEDFFGAGYTHVAQLASFGPPPQIGLSTHTPLQAERAASAGAAYIAVGPVYATATKPTAVPVTLSYVRWAAANVRIPWFAIGGITLENLDSVLAAGARRICIVSGILNAADPATACRSFKERLASIPLQLQP